MEGAVKTPRKRVRKTYKPLERDGRYVFCRNRVAAFTVLALVFPYFGFGFIALPYIRELERYTRSGFIPFLLIVNLSSIVLFLIFWLFVIGVLLLIILF